MNGESDVFQSCGFSIRYDGIKNNGQKKVAAGALWKYVKGFDMDGFMSVSSDLYFGQVPHI